MLVVTRHGQVVNACPTETYGVVEMDQHKIDNFAQDHPGTPFPSMRKLAAEELSLLQGKIFKSVRENLNIKLPEEISRLELLEQDFFPQNAESPDFKLEEAMAQFKIYPDSIVYINWYRFDTVDRIELRDLYKYFDYIWYPGSDDIEVFDSSARWMISVSHSGHTSVKFNTSAL